MARINKPSFKEILENDRKGKKKLNFGSGSDIKKGWDNADFVQSTDICRRSKITN